MGKGEQKNLSPKGIIKKQKIKEKSAGKFK